MYKPIKIKRSDQFYANYWEAYSPKLKRYVNFLGDLNYELWLLLETDPLIHTFCERPIEIKGIINGKKVKAMINMWVETIHNEKYFIGISNSSSPKFNNKLKLIKNWCEDNCHQLKLMGKQQIRKNPTEISNKKHILMYINQTPANELDIYQVKKSFHQSRLTIHELIMLNESNMTKERIISAIYRMITKGEICVDLCNDILSIHSEVKINDKTSEN